MSDESAKTAKIGAFCYQNATKTRATNLLPTDGPRAEPRGISPFTTHRQHVILRESNSIFRSRESCNELMIAAWISTCARQGILPSLGSWFSVGAQIAIQLLEPPYDMSNSGPSLW
jgi:hypothetical protein